MALLTSWQSRERKEQRETETESVRETAIKGRQLKTSAQLN